jgi:outer membrane protein assembly factor BamB
MRQRRLRCGGSARPLRAVLIVAVASLLAEPAQTLGQVFLASPAGNASPPSPQGFTIPTDEALQNSFTDFQRHAERKAWEKAFAALADIPAEKRKGMLARPDGVIIPASQRIWDAIAALPADGRDAFRLFYEAKAKQAWSELTKPNTSWTDQVAAAEKVYQEFFLTSVGDNAADFLADVAFERGDFESAERYWRSILEKHPDSELAESRLLFKRGLALARIGQETAMNGVIRTLEQRFPGQTMKVAGREVPPGEFLRSQLKRPDEGSGTAGASIETHIASAPAADTSPAWRTEFLLPKAVEQRNNSMRQSYYNRNGMETLVPATASDGKRLYVNWFGIVFAVDLSTGKLAWRSQKFSDLNQHFSNLPHSSANLDAYRIVVRDGVVLALMLPLDRLNYYQEPSRLTCLEADTGKVKWKTTDGAFANIGFLGSPLVQEQEILAIGHSRNEAKLSMYCLDLDGKQKWTAELGTVRKRQSSSGYERMPQPAILRQGRTVYIATEDGALAAFDLLDRAVRWTLPYSTEEKTTTRRIFYSGQTDQRTQLHTETALLESDGLLYVKEAGARELLAIDPRGPSIVWRRPAEDASQLVGVDKDSVYLLDDELACINRHDRTLRWATRLPVTTGGLSMLAGPDAIFVLTSRGVFQLSRASGKVVHIFRGVDLAAGGGRLTMAGDRLIAVTPQTLTAYPAMHSPGKATP